jgi:hypothetical protein
VAENVDPITNEDVEPSFPWALYVCAAVPPAPIVIVYVVPLDTPVDPATTPPAPPPPEYSDPPPAPPATTA